MSELAERECIPCRGGVAPLGPEAQRTLLGQIDSDWEIVSGHHLHRSFTFPDFASGLAFVDRVGAIAEEQGHHPDLHLSWGRVVVEIWTHKIDGLHESDFILAAKCDRAYPQS